jgi:NAD(P)-dependent dehydrogenase (short-subunit alcohol dehydrogenase family)
VKAILVTGSSQGIGFGIAKYYAVRNFHVCMNYHKNQEKADKAIATLKELGATPSLHRCDVKDELDVRRMYEEIVASSHQLETVVVNATDEIPKPIDEATFEEWHQVLLTKLDGAFLTIKHAIPLLRDAENPAIIVITSSEGWRPDGEYLAYQVGTAGLISIMIANSRYLCKKYGIRVNAVAPGPVHSGLWAKAGGESDRMWQEFAERTPVGRVATTDDIAAAVWHLAEDPMKFLNGTTVNVDGGKQWV